MVNRENFRKNLTKLINQSGGNQKDLATYVKVSKQTVSAWMHGKAYPRADVMDKIAAYFGTTISALVYDEREQMDLHYFTFSEGNKKSPKSLIFKAFGEVSPAGFEPTTF